MRPETSLFKAFEIFDHTRSHGCCFLVFGHHFTSLVGDRHCTVCAAANDWNIDCSSAGDLDARVQRPLDQRPYSPCLGSSNSPSGRQFAAPTTDRKPHKTLDAICFLCTAGGLKAFGAVGVFIGPIVLAITLA